MRMRQIGITEGSEPALSWQIGLLLRTSLIHIGEKMGAWVMALGGIALRKPDDEETKSQLFSDDIGLDFFVMQMCHN